MQQKLTGVLAFIITIGYVFIQSCKMNQPITGETAVKEYVGRNTDSLLFQLSVLDSALLAKKPVEVLQSAFKKTRLLYKKTEAFSEYFFQGLMKRINGPALPDVKTEDGQVWPPHGFQVIEQYLYSGYHDSLQKTVSNEVKLMQTDLRFIKANMLYTTILPHHMQEIIQHQVIRIAALGLTGFDAPLNKHSLPEAKAALQGVDSVSRLYYGQNSDTSTRLFANCIRYLDRHTDFDSFDRLDFISSYLAPLSVALKRKTTIANADSLVVRPFRGTLDDLLKGRGFNPDYYASYANAVSTDAKYELGRKLFFDPALSSSGKISCGSCHQPSLYFTDGKTKAENLVHGGMLERNTPSIYYASLQSHQFYDLRSVTLEDQANEVIKSHDEFEFSASGIARKLIENTVYKELFRKAFPESTSVSGYEVRNTLAVFVRSLNPFSSRYDAYMQGNKTALNDEEKKGFNLFTGKAKCATCHFLPLFNGNIPPWFIKSESEIIGVPEKLKWGNATIDNDPGRYRINNLNELLYAFKTPTVRNAAMTGPYMHNGIYKTLNEVVEFYHKGGGAGIGMELPFQSLPFDSLQLNSNEKKAIVVFMHSLTDIEKEY